MPRSLLLRAADRLTDHPGPRVRELQRATMFVLFDAALTLIRLGRRLSR